MSKQFLTSGDEEKQVAVDLFKRLVPDCRKVTNVNKLTSSDGTTVYTAHLLGPMEGPRRGYRSARDLGNWVGRVEPGHDWVERAG